MSNRILDPHAPEDHHAAGPKTEIPPTNRPHAPRAAYQADSPPQAKTINPSDANDDLVDVA